MAILAPIIGAIGEALAGGAVAGEAAAGAAAAGEAAAGAATAGETAAGASRFGQFTQAVKGAYDSPTGKTARAAHLVSGGNDNNQANTQPYTIDQANAAVSRADEFTSGAMQTGG
jgi:hypothetical protein